MTLRNPVRFVLLMAAGLLAAGCSRKTALEPWPLSTDPVVYGGAFGDHVIWQAFGNSKLDALSLDRANAHTNGAAMMFSVPASGAYAGGALTTNRLRNLTGYNAIIFWAKASRPLVLETAGFGNDNTGKSKYTAQRSNMTLTADWTQFTIAIPNPARLSAEGGMFFVSEGPKAGGAFTFWIDDVQFVNLATITNPRPVLTAATVDGIVGSPLSLEGSTRTTFAVSGIDQTVTHMAGYFDFVSSDPNVATPIPGGVQVIAGGTTTVTATLSGVNATGAVTVNASAPPQTAAPTPTLPAANVLSMFSGPYTNVTVDTWSANWNQPNGGIKYADVLIAGNPTKRYMNLSYAGIDFSTHLIDATAMTAFHLDVWAPTGTAFLVKLVDFGADGVYGTDDTASELTFNASSTPAFTAGTWVPIEIPLSQFTGLASRSHLAQLVISSPDAKIVYVDNVYFHN